MRRQLLLIIAILAFAVIIAGCAQQQQQQYTKLAELDKDFKLKQGESAFFKSDNMKVIFVNITEDSRCPSEANCFWEGQVTALLRVEYSEVITHDIKCAPADAECMAEFYGPWEHKITLRAGHENEAFGKIRTPISSRFNIMRLVEVNPYPETPEPIKQSDYSIKLIMSEAG